MATILFLVVALDWFRTEWSLFAIRFYTDFYKFSGVKFSTSGQFPVSEFRIGYFFNFLYHPGSSIVSLSCLKLELWMNWFFFVNNRIVRGSNPHDSFFSQVFNSILLKWRSFDQSSCSFYLQFFFRDSSCTK